MATGSSFGDPAHKEKRRGTTRWSCPGWIPAPVREDLKAHPDRLSGLRQGMVGLLMEAEVSARCGAGDGDRLRGWNTRVGTGSWPSRVGVRLVLSGLPRAVPGH